MEFSRQISTLRFTCPITGLTRPWKGEFPTYRVYLTKKRQIQLIYTKFRRFFSLFSRIFGWNRRIFGLSLIVSEGLFG